MSTQIHHSVSSLIKKGQPSQQALGSVWHPQGTRAAWAEQGQMVIWSDSLSRSLDRETWQVTVHRVAKSWTQLKQLSK